MKTYLFAAMFIAILVVSMIEASCVRQVLAVIGRVNTVLGGDK